MNSEMPGHADRHFSWADSRGNIMDNRHLREGTENTIQTTNIDIDKNQTTE